MPTMQNVQSIAAATTVANLLTGLDFERVPRRSVVSLVAAQTDGAAGDISVRMTIGGRTVVPTAGISVNAGAPQNDSDGIGEGVGLPGDLIRVEAINGAVGAVVIGWRVILKPF